MANAGIAYFVIAWLCITTTKDHNVANLWYANAIGILCLASTAGRRGGLALATLAAANFAANMAAGNPPALSLSFVAPNLLTMVVAAYLLESRIDPRRVPTDPQALLRIFALVIALPSALAAVLGASILAVNGFSEFDRAFVNWYVGELLGSLAVLPLGIALLIGRLPNDGRTAAAADQRTGLRQLTDPAFMLIPVLTAGGSYLLLTRFEFPFIWIVSAVALCAAIYTFVQTALVVLVVSVVSGLLISGGHHLLAREHPSDGPASAFASLFLVQFLPLFIAVSVTALRQSGRRVAQSLRLAEQASLTKSRFLANMSHEIRTPLNAIVGTVHTLSLTRLAPDQKRQLASMQVASRNLLSLINDILDLSKIEAGEMKFEVSAFPLQRLLGDVGELMTPIARDRGIRFELAPLSVAIPGTVDGDEARLRQMLLNLASNAVKFTEAGSVSVSVELLARSADRVTLRFSVTDTGIGVAQALQAGLFRPFNQGDSSTTRKYGGTGLGLSIVRLLAEGMGGHAGMESTEGRGSRFWFDVPLIESADAGDAEAALDGVRQLRVLIALEPATLATRIAELSRRLGWHARTVATHEALTSRLGGEAGPGLCADCLIIDLRFAGDDTLRRLRPEQPDGSLPAVVPIDTRPPSDASTGAEISAAGLFNDVNQAVSARTADVDRVFALTDLDRAEDTCWLPDTRILVVDDSTMNLDVCKRLLTHQGAKVVACASGQEALSRLTAPGSDFDAVLMDIQMPEMSGLETSRRLRQQAGLARVPLIALSAGALTEDRHQALAAGMDDFLSKPFEPAHLVRTLRRHVQAYRGTILPAADGTGSAPISAALPAIDGIDVVRAATRVQGDHQLFLTLLRSFAEEHAGTAARIHAWLEAGSNDDAAALLHRLRGQAGNIAATRLACAAAALEAGIADRETPAPARLREFDQSLGALLDAISGWLVESPAAADGGRELPHGERLTRTLAHLRAQLERNAVGAVETSEAVLAMLAGTPLGAAYGPISAALRKLDFRLAQTELERFEQHLE